MIDVLHIELDDKDMMTLKEGHSDGCGYCTGDVGDRPYFNGTSIYIDDNGLVFNMNTGDSFKINFCPMCGRKLN